MIVFINEKNEIKDVGSTTDTTLKQVVVPEYVFNGCSIAKILCFKIILIDGEYAGYEPGVDVRIIEHIDRLGFDNEKNAADVTDIQVAMAELYEMSMEV